jgi:TrmH family RNA methyltransferase
MMPITQLPAAREKYLKKLKQKKFRREYGYFICEGVNLFESALQSADVSIGDIVIDEHRANDFDLAGIKGLKQMKDAQIYRCTERIMSRISDDVTPPGLLFTCKSVIQSDTYLKKIRNPYLIYLDRISDPGNLGTIIRTALWFGLPVILLSPESADPLNSKTVRSTAGAIFSMKIITEISSNVLAEFAHKEKYRIASTLPRGGVDAASWSPPSKCIICLGSEAKGLDPDLIQQAEMQVSVSGSGAVDSLNLAVAAGIIFSKLYEFKQLKR